MSDTKWVQHISGQGDKWEVRGMGINEIVVANKYGSGSHYLPASEYGLCEPPDEEWEDVTRELVRGDLEPRAWVDHDLSSVAIRATAGYRLRKISVLPRGYCFIVERKK